MDLNGKVAIVTGGNGGLGQRICLALARAGCDVAVVYAQSAGPAERIAESVRELGVRAAAFACDVTHPAQVDALVGAVRGEFGRVDVLVNDAAFNKWIPFQDLDALTFDVWQKILSVNLTGPMLCIKAAAAAMKPYGGRIVNISSIAGLAPSGSSIPYAVSKAGLIHLTRCMAVALAPDVLVNCVAPGYLEDTRATANLDPAYKERSRNGALLKRAADKDDVAAQVVSLCETDSITGQTIVVDAGRFFH
ncbi:MAG: SDR family oxidoreductase [Betaproteobacteria bacterium]|nr:SDR family oxidoreductase [Betaproteobacteria bacterium]